MTNGKKNSVHELFFSAPVCWPDSGEASTDAGFVVVPLEMGVLQWNIISYTFVNKYYRVKHQTDLTN